MAPGWYAPQEMENNISVKRFNRDIVDVLRALSNQNIIIIIIIIDELYDIQKFYPAV